MSLSETLISDFVKLTNDTNKESNNDNLLFGTIITYGDNKFVKLDGSDLLTPINKTVTLVDDDRVVLTIKNHVATILGNITSPSASASDLSELGNTVTEFGNVVAHSLTTDEILAVTARIDLIQAQLVQSTAITTEELEAINSVIENIRASYINVDRLTAVDLDSINASFDLLTADLANTYHIETDILNAINADVTFLKTYTADFTYVSAVKMEVQDLQVSKLSAEDAAIQYANIDFANVSVANVGELFTKSGIIADLIVDNETITGRLVGVTIVGDLIDAGTLKADRLIVQGEDGLYYQLNVSGETIEAAQTEYNSLNGEIITAQSITASKIYVSDLSAFNATIGGYKIDSDKIYSGAKSSVDNTTRGAYLDNQGQINFGDSNNYLKFHKEYILTNTEPTDWDTNWTNYFRFFDFYNLTGLNLLTNGDFSNGTANWSAGSATFTSSGGELMLTATAQYGYARTNFGDKILPSGSGRKIYRAATIKTNSPLVYLGRGSGLGKAHSGSGNYERISFIHSDENNWLTSIIDTRTSDWDTVYVKNVITIDLTDTFGTGNEPTAAEMDTWLESKMVGYLPLTNPEAPAWTDNTFYYTTGNYILDIAASSIKFGINNNSLSDFVENNAVNMDDVFSKLAYVEISSDDNNPYIELGKANNQFKVKITNTEMDFLDGTNKVAFVSNESLYIDKGIIKDTLTIGNDEYFLTLTQPSNWSTNWLDYYRLIDGIFVKNNDTNMPMSTWITNTFYYKISGFMWKQRANGNVGFSWIGDDI